MTVLNVPAQGTLRYVFTHNQFSTGCNQHKGRGGIIKYFWALHSQGPVLHGSHSNRERSMHAWYTGIHPYIGSAHWFCGDGFFTVGAYLSSCDAPQALRGMIAAQPLALGSSPHLRCPTLESSRPTPQASGLKLLMPSAEELLAQLFSQFRGIPFGLVGEPKDERHPGQPGHQNLLAWVSTLGQTRMGARGTEPAEGKGGR